MFTMIATPLGKTRAALFVIKTNLIHFAHYSVGKYWADACSMEWCMLKGRCVR